MAELATIARPYAGAVFNIAKREKALDQWSGMLGVLSATTAQPRVVQLLAAPDMPASAKAYKLAEVCGTELDDRGKKLLQALALNDRLALIGEIQTQFEVLRAQEEQSLDVEVISAFELSDAEENRIRDALAKRFEKEVTLESRVDASLLGGAIIRAGDTVIDGSARGKLNKLTEALTRQ